MAPLRRFNPRVGTWLNFAPDHQDVHLDLAGYEAAKANLWARATEHELAVANADDPVVMAHARAVPRVETFGLAAPGGAVPDWHVAGGALRDLTGAELLRVDDGWGWAKVVPAPAAGVDVTPDR